VGASGEVDLAARQLVPEPRDVRRQQVAARIAQRLEPLPPDGARQPEVVHLAADQQPGPALDEQPTVAQLDAAGRRDRFETW
jgi:hypothetical protein